MNVKKLMLINYLNILKNNKEFRKINIINKSWRIMHKKKKTTKKTMISFYSRNRAVNFFRILWMIKIYLIKMK